MNIAKKAAVLAISLCVFTACTGKAQDAKNDSRERGPDAVKNGPEAIFPGGGLEGFTGVYSFGRDDEILEIAVENGAPELRFHFVSGDAITPGKTAPLRSLSLYRDGFYTTMHPGAPLSGLASGRLRIDGVDYHVFFLAGDMTSLREKSRLRSSSYYPSDDFDYRKLDEHLFPGIPPSVKEGFRNGDIAHNQATLQDVIRVTGTYRSAEFRFLPYAGTYDEFENPDALKTYRESLSVNVVLPRYGSGFFFNFASPDTRLEERINRQMAVAALDTAMTQVNTQSRGGFLHYYNYYLPERDIFTCFVVCDGTLYLNHWHRDAGYSAIRGVFVRVP